MLHQTGQIHAAIVGNVAMGKIPPLRYGKSTVLHLTRRVDTAKR